MDIKAFANAAVAGVPLLFVLVGLVEWLKSFRDKAGAQLIHGNGLLLASMFFGLVLGSGYMVAQTRPPTGDWWVGYVYWFGVVIYGSGLGIVASGLFSAVKKLLKQDVNVSNVSHWNIKKIE